MESLVQLIRVTDLNDPNTQPRDILIHQLGCSKFGGPTDRHHYVVAKALERLLRECNYSTAAEYPLGPDRRMDIVAEKDSENSTST